MASNRFAVLWMLAVPSLIFQSLPASDARIHNFDEVLRAYKHIGRGINQLLAQKIHESHSHANNSLFRMESHLPPFPNLTQACSERIGVIISQTATLPPPTWLIRLLDAQAKPPADILDGNIAWFGGFQECMNLTAYRNDSNPTPDTLLVEGQYCLATVELGEHVDQPKVPLLGIPKALRAGLCVPTNCTADDVKQLLYFVIGFGEEQSKGLFAENVTISDVHCPAKTIPLDSGAIVIIVMLSLFVIIVLIGSFYDVLTSGLNPEGDGSSLDTPVYTSSYTSLLPPDSVSAADREADVREPKAALGRFCKAVSAVPHLRRIFWATHSPNELRWIHGIRVLSMIWIILGQTYALGMPVYNNLMILPEAMKGLFAQIIVQSTFAVDTFLFLSGFLVASRFLSELTAHGFDCLTLLRLYLSRYLRLFPAYMVILGVYATLTKYISSGPLWPQDEGMLGNCSHLAWTNAFYVNNFVRPEEMCMPWTWYIAIDFQLFILAPLIVLCLFAFWKIGLGLCVVMIWAATVTAAVISKVKGLPPSLFGFGSTDISTFDQELILRYFTDYFITTYCRAAPYFFGIAIAHHLRNPSEVVRFNLLSRVVGWILALMGMGIVVFGLVPGFNGYPLSIDAAAAFNSLSHIVWSCGLVWIAYNCVVGSAGIVGHFLAWRMWTPLSTISYSTYLFAPVMICVYYFSREETIRFSHYNAINLFWGNLIFSLLAGLGIYIFIEAPVRNLSKLVLTKKVNRTNLVEIPS